MNSKIKEIGTIAVLGVVALLAAKNWGTLKSIGSGVNTKVSSALNTINSAVSDSKPDE